MKVIVCGAGQVGWQIARHLSAEDNDVTIVDNNAELVAQATDALDVGGVSGFASYPDILDRAGARDADMIIAATHSDEVNMVTCQVAHSVFQVPRKVARLRAQSYRDVIYSDLYQRDHLPIDVVISPEQEVAEAALRQLAAPSTFDNEPFLGGTLQMLGISVDGSCAVLNTPLRQLSELFSTLRARIAGIRRDGRLFQADPEDQLYENDLIYAFVHRDDVSRMMEIFGKVNRQQERVIIVGGGNVGLAVARKLERRESRLRSKVIERDRATAEEAAEALERTIVLHGDGLDLELLEEANLKTADAVLSVTDDDKTNLLVATRAKAAGCDNVIALINDPDLASLRDPLKIDAFIQPRATTVSSILRHVRHGRVSQVYSIGDAEAEVIEAQVMGTSPISGTKLRDVDFPEGSIAAAVQKGDQLIVPDGDTRIDEGDTVVLFSMVSTVPQVEQLLQVRVDFF